MYNDLSGLEVLYNKMEYPCFYKNGIHKLWKNIFFYVKFNNLNYMKTMGKHHVFSQLFIILSHRLYQVIEQNSKGI